MLLKKNSKHHPKVKAILEESQPSPTDVQGSYTGIANADEKNSKPIQDADDL